MLTQKVSCVIYKDNKKTGADPETVDGVGGSVMEQYFQ
jgi:hypothetical protein